MPTYEYECTECLHAFEKLQPITAKPLRKCPMCQGVLRRLIGPGGVIIFKGSGFYETDYKRKHTSGPPQPAKPAEKTATSTKTKTETAKNTENPK